MSATIKVGDRVNVKVNRRGCVQAGTVVELLPNGRGFAWVNACNFRRQASFADVTTKPEAEDDPPAIIREWMEEPGE